jgi:uncharacterized membrane protein YwaF
LVDTTECIMLHPKCCTIQGCYKWVQLYYFVDFMIINFANSQISGLDLDPDLRYVSHSGLCLCGIFRSHCLKCVCEVIHPRREINQHGMCLVVAWVKSWSLAVFYIIFNSVFFLFSSICLQSWL